MGMFDYLRCKLPLPVLGACEMQFQTKDTGSQFLDLYEIREDGTLWHEAYDVEDRSDPNAEGFARMIGMITKVNQRWEQVKSTGEIRFYDFPTGNHKDGGWIEFSAYFVDGNLKELHLVENTLPVSRAQSVTADAMYDEGK